MSKSFWKWLIVNMHFRFNCYWGKAWHFKQDSQTCIRALGGGQCHLLDKKTGSKPQYSNDIFTKEESFTKNLFHKDKQCAHFYLKVRDKLLQRILWSDQTFMKTRISSCCITTHLHMSYSLCEFFPHKTEFLIPTHPLLHHLLNLAFWFFLKKEMKLERDTISYHPKHSKEFK